MKAAIFALSSQGTQIGIKIRKELKKDLEEVVLYLPSQSLPFAQEDKEVEEGFSLWAGSLKKKVKEVWEESEVMIFIMACGIVTRLVAPHIRDKYVDPAIVVVDEKARHVVSLLSGHWGGANDLTARIAEVIGACPVITTASDLRQKVSLDILAKKLNCSLENKTDLKRVASAILRDEEIAIFSEVSLDSWRELLLSSNIQIFPWSIKKWERDYSTESSYVFITDELFDPPKTSPYLILRPQRIVAGVGSRRGVSKEEVLEAIEKSFAQASLSLTSLSKIATSDIKRREQGIRKAAEELQIPLVFFSKEEMLKVEGKNSSKLVKKKIGVEGVCEQAALLASRKGELILPKKIWGRVTVALVKNSEIEGARGEVEKGIAKIKEI